MALTHTAILNAKAADKVYKLYDSDGLFLQVTPSGGKWWRFKFRFDGKEKLLSFGVYPDISLSQARKKETMVKYYFQSKGEDNAPIYGWTCTWGHDRNFNIVPTNQLGSC